MAELEQVLGRHPPALDVVDRDAGQARVLGVDERDGHAGRLEAAQLLA